MVVFVSLGRKKVANLDTIANFLLVFDKKWVHHYQRATLPIEPPRSIDAVAMPKALKTRL